MRNAITPDGAVTVGPYSAAISHGDLLICSGQTPVDPATGKLVDTGIADQTRQCFANLGAVSQAADCSFDDVIQVKVYLTDMENFEQMNAAYAEHFESPFPSRTTIGVASLPLYADVEIELIAARPTAAS